MAHAAYVAVYCVAVLAVLLVALFGYRAWQQYRRTMREVLQRRHERDLERGDLPIRADDYWIGVPPPLISDTYPEARPVAHSPGHKPIKPLLQPKSTLGAGSTAQAATTDL